MLFIAFFHEIQPNFHKSPKLAESSEILVSFFYNI